MEKDRTGKYLKYAFGEIFLVVIGILIALQINNWNEQSKSHDFELKMLKEIEIALTDDLEHFKLMSERMQKLKANANAFLPLIADGHSFSDSLEDKMFGLNMGIYMQYNRGPYDAIKASGIDKIANDSLRNKLIHFYDFLYPRFITRLEHYNRNHTRDIEQIVGFQEDPTVYKIDGKAFITQKFAEDVMERPEFLRVLRSIQFRSISLERTIREFLPDMQELLEQIESESHIR